jgi:hypothetical protein
LEGELRHSWLIWRGKRGVTDEAITEAVRTLDRGVRTRQRSPLSEQQLQKLAQGAKTLAGQAKSKKPKVSLEEWAGRMAFLCSNRE